MKKIIWMTVAGAWLLLTGCNSSRIVYSWKSEEPASGKFEKIMVVALIRDSDRSLQEKMETHLVENLQTMGYKAVASIKEWGPKAFDKMDEAAVLDKLKNTGVDAVMTIVMLDKSRERYYVPGRVVYSPYGIYHSRFYGYYITLYDRIYSPGYYGVSTRYFWESNLFDLTNKKVLYTAQTESFDPASAERLGHEYGELILGDMQKKMVLPR